MSLAVQSAGRAGLVFLPVERFFLPALALALGLAAAPPEMRGAGLSDHTTALFSGSAPCAFCHDQGGGALRDRKGNDLSIVGDWRGTMMAHAFQDPFWRARLEAEVKEHPHLKSFIEDKCQTCHAPMARTQARHDGAGELAFSTGLADPLSVEGVSCTLCHQVQDHDLGRPASFSGGYLIGANRIIFGPYDEVVAMPMRRHVEYTPQFGRHTQESELCATCHTLYTPILDEAGRVVGQFPEQTPYLEWRNSLYPKRGQTCQECHMPRVEEPVKISARPPWLGPRKPFWRHQFVGGNTLMLRLLAAGEAPGQALAEPQQFQPLIAAARRQIQRAATLRVKGRRQGEQAVLEVEVQNLAGHKFPTGYPDRRAWLHVRVTDAEGRTVFESGGHEQGRIRGLPGGQAPHYDQITEPGQVQIYQAILGDGQGVAAGSLLQARFYLKDNRLPPRGFSNTGEGAADTRIRGGAEQDANFNRKGSGADRVTYRIDLKGTAGRLRAEVALLYQPIPPESVERLRAGSGRFARAFAESYARADKSPETVHRVKLEL